MKTLNYLLTGITGISWITLFFYGASGHEVKHFTGQILGGMALTIIFFLFALIEERNEEIQKLRLTTPQQNISKQPEHLTISIGNDKAECRSLPRLLIRGENKSAPEYWAHIKQQTGLDFKPTPWKEMEAQPQSSEQIVKFFLCTNHWKMWYYNNSDWKNTLMLKDDHGVGFKVNSICYDCVKHNQLRTQGLEPGDRLSC